MKIPTMKCTQCGATWHKETGQTCPNKCGQKRPHRCNHGLSVDIRKPGDQVCLICVSP